MDLKTSRERVIAGPPLMATCSDSTNYPSLIHPCRKGQRYIRLLKIHSAEDPSQRIQCTLMEASLDDTEIQFDALSYRCGDPASTVPIVVNGLTLQVTRNLEEALRRFRRDPEGLAPFLWADAICIHQSDLEERGAQVSIMHDIYRKAANVRVWLGEGDTSMIRGLETLERFSRCPCNRSHPLVCWTGIMDDFLGQIDLEVFACLERLCEAEYWQRVWIVQEASLAASLILHCGNRRGTVQCWARVLAIVNMLWRHLFTLPGNSRSRHGLDIEHNAPDRMAPEQHNGPLCPSAQSGVQVIQNALYPIYTARMVIGELLLLPLTKYWEIPS